MSTTRKYGGTGLGLNLVKQLVEAHEGTIRVQSKMNVGTLFTFTLKVRGCSKVTGVAVNCHALNAKSVPPAVQGVRRVALGAVCFFLLAVA